MSWEDGDSLNEEWLPTWVGDDKVTPEEPPPPPPADPDDPLRTNDAPECRVNLALWWLALLQDGPPPSGDWVEFVDIWDGPPTIHMTLEEFSLDGLMNYSSTPDQDPLEDVLDQFRISDGDDVDA